MEMPQEMFDELVRDAIEDLMKSGLEKEEITTIVEDQFGYPYVQKFCEKAVR